MKILNILSRFILLTILLFAPLSAIEAKELWSYDPNKDIEDLQYWTVSTITMSEDNKYVAVGLYRNYYISSDCIHREDFGTREECHKEESKILLFDISGKLLWEHKTTNKIESTYFSTDSKYILLNNSPTSAHYHSLGYNDRLYLFNIEGELLWIYDDAIAGRIDSDEVVLFTINEMKTIRIKIDKNIIEEYPNIGIYSANRDLSKVLFTNTRNFEDQIAPKYVGVMDKSGKALWKKDIREDGVVSSEKSFISDDGKRVILLEKPYLISSNDPVILYFFNDKGEIKSTYQYDGYLLQFATSKDGEYSVLAYQTDIKARGTVEGNFSTEKYYNKFVLLDDSGSIVWESTILESPYSLSPYSINICNDKPYILFGLAIREGMGSLFIMDRKSGEIINMIDFDVKKIQVSPGDSYAVIVRGEGNNCSKIFLYKTEELVKINDKTESKDENKSNYPNQLVYVVAIALILVGAYYYKRKH